MTNAKWLGVLLVGALVGLAGCKKEQAPEGSAGSTAQQPLAQPGGGVTFAHKALAVGQRMVKTEDMVMKMAMSIDMSAMGGKKETTTVARHEHSVLESKVLASDEDGPTKVEVTYKERADVDTENGKEKRLPNPVLGKTYLVEVKDDLLTVRDPDGEPVSQAEEKLVQADHVELGRRDTVAAALNGKSIQPGQEVPELAKVIEAELNKDASQQQGESNISGVKVKLREQKDGVALFDVAVLFTQKQGPMQIHMDLKGTLGVRIIDTQPSQLTLKGPVTIDFGSPKGAAAAAMQMSGSGEMSLALSQRYL